MAHVPNFERGNPGLSSGGPAEEEEQQPEVEAPEEEGAEEEAGCGLLTAALNPKA